MVNFENSENTFELVPLTPVYTGENLKEPNMSIRESGIMGSLRYWHSVMLSQKLNLKTCQYNKEQCKCVEKSDIANLCHSCSIFGCTGYSKPFKLIVESEPEYLSTDNSNFINIGSKNSLDLSKEKFKFDAKKQHKGWRIFKEKFNIIRLRFILLRDFDREYFWNSIAETLRFIEENAGLGAKTPQGCGIIKVNNNNDKNDFLNNYFKNKHQKLNNKNDVFLLIKINFKFNGNHKIVNFYHQSATDGNILLNKTTFNDCIILSPMIRYKIRGCFRNNKNSKISYDDRHYYMGDRGRGSHIMVSNLYRIENNTFQMRIFGLIKNNFIENLDFLTDDNELISNISSLFDPTPEISIVKRGI